MCLFLCHNAPLPPPHKIKQTKTCTRAHTRMHSPIRPYVGARMYAPTSPYEHFVALEIVAASRLDMFAAHDRYYDGDRDKLFAEANCVNPSNAAEQSDKAAQGPKADICCDICFTDFPAEVCARVQVVWRLPLHLFLSQQRRAFARFCFDCFTATPLTHRYQHRPAYSNSSLRR